MDELEPVLGDKYSPTQLIEALRNHEYNVEKVISWFLDGNSNFTEISFFDHIFTNEKK